MNGIILAGGEGQRLRPYTETIPKPMLEISGKPLLYWLIDQLARAGVKEVVLMENYLSGSIQEYFDKANNGFDIRIIHALDMQPNKGTSELVKMASNLFTDTTGDTFIMAGDTLIDVDLEEVGAYHQTKDTLVTVIGRKEKLQHGVLECDSEDKIVDVQEKPEVMIPTATMLLKRQVLDSVNETGDFFLNVASFMEESGCVFEVAPDKVIHVSEYRDDLVRANDVWTRIQTERGFSKDAAHLRSINREATVL